VSNRFRSCHIVVSSCEEHEGGGADADAGAGAGEML